MTVDDDISPRVERISKSFPAVNGLDTVTFSVRGGHVVRPLRGERCGPVDARADQINPDKVIARMVGRRLDQQYPKEELPT